MKYFNILDVMVYLNKDAGDITIVLIIIDSVLWYWDTQKKNYESIVE